MDQPACRSFHRSSAGCALPEQEHPEALLLGPHDRRTRRTSAPSRRGTAPGSSWPGAPAAVAERARRRHSRSTALDKPLEVGSREEQRSGAASIARQSSEIPHGYTSNGVAARSRTGSRSSSSIMKMVAVLSRSSPRCPHTKTSPRPATH